MSTEVQNPQNVVVEEEKRNIWSKVPFIRKRVNNNKVHATAESVNSASSQKSKASSAKGENEEREGWSNPYQFFLASLGYAIGLSCIWRFPTLTYQDGGGAFLIPYVILSIVIGIPMVFLELAVGQFTSTGTFTCWTMSKAFQGIGIAMNFSNAYVCIYYNLIIGYSLYYLVLSFTSTLPWSKCDPSWASVNCVDNYNSSVFKYTPCTDNYQYKCTTGQFGRCLSNPQNFTNTTYLEQKCQLNDSSLYVGWYNPTFPSQDYWNKVVLQKSDSIENSGGLIWQLVVALLAAWLIVYFITVRGVDVVGKIVYFTTSFPFVLLFIIGVQGWMLDGAGLGISYFITPRMDKLWTVQVWSDAAIQVFYTLSISYGGLLTYASYNNFNAPILRDASILSILSCLTSIFCGFVIFPYLGYLAKNTGQPIDTIIQSDQGLAFILFPFAVSTLKVAPLWAILFFIMILIIGVDNMMASIETGTTALLDVVPYLKKKKSRKYMTSAAICTVYFLVGLLFCSRAGSYWVQLFDQYSGNWALLMTATLECLSVTVFYGFENFRSDLSAMIGVKIAYSKWFVIFKYLWLIVCPAIFLFLIIYGFVTFERLSIGNYVFPAWCDIIGQLANVATVSAIIIFIIYKIREAIKKKEPIMSAFKPASSWIPLRLKDRVFVNLMHIKESYTKRDENDVFKWSVADETSKSKKDKDKEKKLRQQTNLPVDLFVVEFPTAEQRQQNGGAPLRLDDIMIAEEAAHEDRRNDEMTRF